MLVLLVVHLLLMQLLVAILRLLLVEPPMQLMVEIKARMLLSILVAQVAQLVMEILTILVVLVQMELLVVDRVVAAGQQEQLVLVMLDLGQHQAQRKTITAVLVVRGQVLTMLLDQLQHPVMVAAAVEQLEARRAERVRLVISGLSGQMHQQTKR